MSVVGDQFTKRMGAAASQSPLGFRFPMEWDQVVLDDLHEEIGAGAYLDGFIYLLGLEVNRYNVHLEHWSFLFPNEKERDVIGRNAYGSLLVVEDATNEGTTGVVGVIDVLNVRYFTHPALDFMGLFGNWLPNERLPFFMDNSVYQQYRNEGGKMLGANEVLGIIEPLSLGGEMQLDNFQVEPLDTYYRTVTKIYRDALK